ncbi:MAG: hypothetical protein KDA78_15000, partial [Planctomycetaceae bacterium]|nr:hypothetical protein [Planctomycetaceae bacterium]
LVPLLFETWPAKATVSQLSPKQRDEETSSLGLKKKHAGGGLLSLLSISPTTAGTGFIRNHDEQPACRHSE